MSKTSQVLVVAVFFKSLTYHLFPTFSVGGKIFNVLWGDYETSKFLKPFEEMRSDYGHFVF